MNFTPLVVVGISLVGSFFGAYLAIKVTLARFEERLASVAQRLDRHSNRLNRLEDSHFQKS